MIAKEIDVFKETLDASIAEAVLTAEPLIIAGHQAGPVVLMSLKVYNDLREKAYGKEEKAPARAEPDACDLDDPDGC